MVAHAVASEQRIRFREVILKKKGEEDANNENGDDDDDGEVVDDPKVLMTAADIRRNSQKAYSQSLKQKSAPNGLSSSS